MKRALAFSFVLLAAAAPASAALFCALAVATPTTTLEARQIRNTDDVDMVCALSFARA